jgi:hypothetical protein
MKRLAHKFLLFLLVVPAGLFLLSHGKQMYANGGFESLPDHSPLEDLTVDQDKMSINAGKDAFSFAVLGDMRWDSSPRIAILRDDHSLTADATQQLAGIISGHNVAAIFSGHIHDTLNYTWQEIPVYITSLKGSSWKGTEPAEYLLVSVSGEKTSVQTISVHRKAERGA